MMREILFRGKRLDNGEWLEGDLVHSVYKIGDTCVGTYGRSFGVHQVATSTVGQYTGLMDKNGKRIWEGDVVKIKGDGVYLCVWSECNLEFSLTNVKESFGMGYLPMYNAKVIGNIHDNQELLEGGASE